MSSITMVKEIKAIHPTDIAFIKSGTFYKCYGKDAYIVSKNLKYKIQIVGKNIVTCGFPINSINKVRAVLENKKINYMLINSRDNYSIDEKEDFKNLNNYLKEYEKSKTYVNNQIKIDKIYEYLNMNSDKEELKEILKQVEEIIGEKGEF